MGKASFSREAEKDFLLSCSWQRRSWILFFWANQDAEVTKIIVYKNHQSIHNISLGFRANRATENISCLVLPHRKPTLGHTDAWGHFTASVVQCRPQVKNSGSFWRTHHIFVPEWTFNLLQMDHSGVLMPSLSWAYCQAASSCQQCTEITLLFLFSSLLGDSPGRFSLFSNSFCLAPSRLWGPFPDFPLSWQCSSLIHTEPYEKAQGIQALLQT